MTNGEAITELHMLQCRFHQIRKSDAAWEAIEMAKDALLARWLLEEIPRRTCFNISAVGIWRHMDKANRYMGLV